MTAGDGDPVSSPMPRAVFVASSCSGKSAFETFDLANQIATRSRRRGRKGQRLKPYHCRFCKSWHIGSGQ